MERSSNNVFGLCFFLLYIFILINHVTSFDVTKMLSQQHDFSSFINSMTQTQVASQINSRQSITILALDNAAMSKISGKPTEVLKKILEVHVILDYYDVQKLQNLKDKTALLTTLFQASGQANGQQGFVNVTDTESGSVVFGSAVPGASLSSDLVKSVVSQPYNISVLQISNPIVPPGIENSKSQSTAGVSSRPPSGAPSPTSTTPPPSAGASPQKSKTPTPSSAPPQKSKTPTPSSAPPQKSKTPTPSSAPSPSGSKSSPPTSADAPSTESDVPTGSSPVSAPAASPLANGPVAADGPAAGIPADNSDGRRIGGGFGMLIFALLLIGSLI